MSIETKLLIVLCLLPGLFIIVVTFSNWLPFERLQKLRTRLGAQPLQKSEILIGLFGSQIGSLCGMAAIWDDRQRTLMTTTASEVMSALALLYFSWYFFLRHGSGSGGVDKKALVNAWVNWKLTLLDFSLTFLSSAVSIILFLYTAH